jgi:hypothetical protein
MHSVLLSGWGLGGGVAAGSITENPSILRQKKLAKLAASTDNIL